MFRTRLHLWLAFVGCTLANAATPAVRPAIDAGPVRFEPNRGQFDTRVQFAGRIGARSIAFGAATLAVGGVQLHFRGANPNTAIAGEDLLPARSFYYQGSDPRSWRKEIPNYARLRFHDLYPGIDCVFYGSTSGTDAPGGRRSTGAISRFQNAISGEFATHFSDAAIPGSSELSDGDLEYDLLVAPHADPTQVVLEIAGARSLSITPEGDLEIRTGDRRLVQRRPRVLQGGHEIAARYRIDGTLVSYDIASYDPGAPLLIDPVLDYATYFGGNASDILTAIASDKSGNVYVTGQTDSTNFVPSLLVGESPQGGTDVLLTKFDPTGGTVLFSALLGSSGNDTARNLAVDSAGDVYIVGQAGAANFPVLNAYQPSVGNPYRPPNGFVAKLSSAGSLIFSTYLGGTVSPDLGPGVLNTSTAIQTVAPDNKGNVWVGGWTFATDFPCTLGPAPDPVHYPYVFVTGFTASGSLVQSMTFSSAYNDITLVTAVAPDGAGNIVVAASTVGNMPTTAEAVQPAFQGGAADVFVARLNPAGNAANYIQALTYLGGIGIDEADGLTLDSAGNVYIIGSTSSVDFPVTAGGIQSHLTGSSGAFLAKLNPTLSAIEFGTYFGGIAGSEVTPRDVRLDGSGDIFIAGYTDYSDLTPTALGANAAALQPAYGGAIDGFIMELSPAGAPQYFTYFGGSAADYIFGMTLDSSGNLYAAGLTNSMNLPVSKAYQSSLSTPPDGFFLRLSTANPNTVSITSVNVAGHGATSLAQNTWIEIHGANFAPAGTALTWSTAPSFAMGQMPVLLGGVSVTVNGNPAFIYYVSPTQVNVLTPLDATTGPVEIVLTSGTTASAPFTANLQTVSPSFLLFGATTYIAATHADGALLGPASLSAPGYIFTPAQPGEIIVLYGVGFGMPSTQLVDGSASQSGDLPVLPVIRIGGVAATLTFAGVVSPGLYQFDVQVPPGAASGDISVVATYGGSSTPAADLITVQN